MKLLKRKIPEPYDIWDTETSINNKIKSKSKQKIKSHPCMKRKNKNPLPHPGQSYNPDPDDHENLLNKIAKKEILYQKRQKSINDAVKVKVDKKEIEEADNQELFSGITHLIEENQSENSEDSDTDAAYSDYDEKDFEAITKIKKVVENRKTRRQRLRQLKDRLIRKAAKLRKIKNIRLSKLDGVKKVIKEIDNEVEVHRKKSRKQRKERFCQKRVESDPIYCLKSELPSNLRKINCPMDAIVREQLECFQSRLMIEPTQLQSKKKKYKKKAFERGT